MIICFFLNWNSFIAGSNYVCKMNFLSKIIITSYVRRENERVSNVNRGKQELGTGAAQDYKSNSTSCERTGFWLVYGNSFSDGSQSDCISYLKGQQSIPYPCISLFFLHLSFILRYIQLIIFFSYIYIHTYISISCTWITFSVSKFVFVHCLVFLESVRMARKTQQCSNFIFIEGETDI